MSERMVTPEAVALELETANVGSRIIAFLLDTVVVTIGGWVLGLTFAPFLSDGVSLPFALVFSVVLLLVLAWTMGYYILQETLWHGRTLGKAALGLRVVTREGGQIRFRHALIRAILGIVDFGLSSGFVAVVSILATRSNQRLGDMAAGTLVLRERTSTRAPAPVSFAPPRGLESYAAMLDTSRVTAREYQAARSFLLRTDELLPAARQRLAVRLADQVATLVAPPPPTGIPAESFLAAVAAAYQVRQRPAQPSAPMPPPGTPPPGTPPPGAPAEEAATQAAPVMPVPWAAPSSMPRPGPAAAGSSGPEPGAGQPTVPWPPGPGPAARPVPSERPGQQQPGQRPAAPPPRDPPDGGFVPPD